MTMIRTARTTTPIDYTCRSQIYRRHLSSGARFEELAGSAVVADYSGAGDEAHQSTQLALADLSTLPRTGFKGTGAPDWLEEHGAKLPNSPNQAAQQEDGSLVARLSNDESLILGDLNAESTLPSMLQERWSLESARRVYPLPRRDSHCWFALTGKHASAMLAKVCGVDMRTHKFAAGTVAQTSLARVNAIILRNDLATTSCLFILSDVSSAEYLWDALLDAMAEFEGCPVGIAALRALLAD
jgi:sarcosine oxidase, subunit gamma